jgi:hypothetical protein
MSSFAYTRNNLDVKQQEQQQQQKKRFQSFNIGNNLNFDNNKNINCKFGGSVQYASKNPRFSTMIPMNSTKSADVK